MVNAAAATITAIANYSPDIIINQGICGGHDPAIHRGDILIGAEIFPYSNLRIGPCSSENPLNGCSVIGLEPLSGCNVSSPETLGGYNATDTKAAAIEKNTLFYSDPALVARAQSCPAPADNVRIFTGRIGSADAWLDRKDLIRHMHETFHTSGEDMESAAVAQLCFSFHIPFLSLRTLSNTLVHDEEYDETTAAMIQQFTLSFLNENW
jgi:adenosylhomocysteine nucleosidase